VAAGNIVITGGTSGIGRAAALGFAAKGWQVATCGRRQEKLDEVRATGSLAIASPVDVTDPAAVAAFFSDVRKQFGRIDVVFNNAGAFSAASTFGDIEVATWQKMIDTNLNGAFYVAREAFRAMRDQTPQGGRIINNGSVSAHSPRPGSAPYTITKHGITGLTKSLALDGRAFSIACGQIDIGNAATDMTRRMSSGVRQPDGQMRSEPVMDAQNVADAVAYMAGLPLDANALWLTVMATDMPLVGRG
jgi:NAD(P)-dependent dehydrogenase (short-subunit alcohol dehydrogenase family)